MCETKKSQSIQLELNIQTVVTFQERENKERKIFMFG